MQESEAAKLWKAAQNDDLKTVKALVASADPKRDREALDRALFQAVFHRHPDVADLLLSAGADPEYISSTTVLACAASRGDIDLVKKLIKAGADYNREYRGETALSAALAENKTTTIDYLEKLGAYSPPNSTLFNASKYGDVERAQRALAAGGEVETTGGMFGDTPLMVASRNGHLAAVKLLLQHGAKPNTKIKEKTALFEAVEYRRNEIFEALVESGADIHAKYYDETVLMAAARGGSLPIVKRLVELGANVHARDKNFGVTAMDRASQNKHKEIVEFLSTLGAISDRDGARDLMRALAKEFGGKVVEHSHGFLLNSQLSGNKCQFNTQGNTVSVAVTRLTFSFAALRKSSAPTILFSAAKRPDHFKAYHKSESSSQMLGIEVSTREESVDQKILASFCSELKPFIPNLKLAGTDCLLVIRDSIKLLWHGTEISEARSRLLALGALVQAVTRPPIPDRSLFEKEWLLKYAPKSAAKKSAPHIFGGALAQPIACPECRNAINRMIQIDLADPNLPATPLGRKPLPFFWCLECLEWDATSYNVSGPIPKLIQASGTKSKSSTINPGEEDLPERAMTLVPVAPGKKAGRKSKIGGLPTWIQSEETPECPKCEKPMAFVLQLASNSHIAFSDMGMLYAFACPECKIATSLIQSH